MKHKLRLILLPPIAFLICCIHLVTEELGYQVKENHKEALIFHDGAHSHLVVSTKLGASQTPSSIAWVIPLPAKPISTKQAPRSLFKALYNELPDTAVHTRSVIPFSCSAAVPVEQKSPIVVHAIEQVGDYTIQPVEIRANDGGKALNTWLSNNGYSPVPTVNQSYYLKPGTCFMCVKVTNIRETWHSLPGLHFTFKSDTPVFPLKFSSHSGVFDVDLYTASAKPIPLKTFETQHLHYHSSKLLTNSSSPIFKKLSRLGAASYPRLYLSRFKGSQINSQGKEVTSMPADPNFTP